MPPLPPFHPTISTITVVCRLTTVFPVRAGLYSTQKFTKPRLWFSFDSKVSGDRNINKNKFGVVKMNGKSKSEVLVELGNQKLEKMVVPVEEQSYEKAIQCLNSLQTNAAALDMLRKLGANLNKRSLPEMIEFLRRCGYNVEELNRLNVIHITGTKGKGSTAAFVESMLRRVPRSMVFGANKSGNLKTGLYTSPHLIAVRERIRINGSPITETLFTQYFFEVWNSLQSTLPPAPATSISASASPSIDNIPHPPLPTYFRFLTLLSFHVFMKEKVDVSILEVGIGGEYDSTNVVPKPVVCGIASLGLDHQAVLGHTVKEIAWHKGGICKPDVPCVSVPQPIEGMTVLMERAKERCSPFFVAPPLSTHPDPSLSTLPLGLRGAHQTVNASLALSLVLTWTKRLSGSFSSSNATLNTESDDSGPPEFDFTMISQELKQVCMEGLKSAKWPGRAQIVRPMEKDSVSGQEKEGRVVYYLDGAHTVESLECCVEWWESENEKELRNDKIIRCLVFNVTSNRDPKGLLAPLAKYWYRVKEQTGRKGFEVVVFTSNETGIDKGSGDLTNYTVHADKQLEGQHKLARVWKELVPEYGEGDGEGEGVRVSGSLRETEGVLKGVGDRAEGVKEKRCCYPLTRTALRTLTLPPPRPLPLPLPPIPPHPQTNPSPSQKYRLGILQSQPLNHSQAILLVQKHTTLKKYNLRDFELLETVGTGTFGRVFLTRLKSPIRSPLSPTFSSSSHHHHHHHSHRHKQPNHAPYPHSSDHSHHSHSHHHHHNHNHHHHHHQQQQQQHHTNDEYERQQELKMERERERQLYFQSQSQNQSEMYFAMKVLKKSEVVRLKQVEHINSEKSILSQISHPFIVNLFTTFQDSINVYMLLEYIPGGELFSHLRKAGRFPNDVTIFYAAEIVSAIEYLHEHDIIYRDLKPENLLLDERGHVKITDFGFSKKVTDRTWTLCGTPEYLAPEIIQGKGHGRAVDWWALGILIYEMLAGYPPFFDDNPFGIYEKILASKIHFPSHFSNAARDLIKRLLTSDISKRLGNLKNGANDVKFHPWFKDVDWNLLMRRGLQPPIVPLVRGPGDTSNFERYPEPTVEEMKGLGVYGSSGGLGENGSEVDPFRHLFEDF